MVRVDAIGESNIRAFDSKIGSWKRLPMTEKRECGTCRYGKDGLPTWGFILCERCSCACTCKDNWQPKEAHDEHR